MLKRSWLWYIILISFYMKRANSRNRFVPSSAPMITISSPTVAYMFISYDPDLLGVYSIFCILPSICRPQNPLFPHLQPCKAQLGRSKGGKQLHMIHHMYRWSSWGGIRGHMHPREPQRVRVSYTRICTRRVRVAYVCYLYAAFCRQNLRHVSQQTVGSPV
jgi:hypothetical protein